MNTTTAPPILDRLSALGDPTRTRILALLECSEFTVSELCSVLQTAQPTVSRHLKALSFEGWVEARADGRNRHYRLNPDLDEAGQALWAIVRDEIGRAGVYAEDSERAVSVLDHRRLRSQAFFAETAARWDVMRAEMFGSGSGLAPLLGLIEAEWTVGDLGAGTGALAARLAPMASRVVAVDRSEEMLATARVRLEAASNVDLRHGDLEALPLEDDELDLAILALVLHYVVDPARVLEETARALRPGGKLLLLDMRAHERSVGFGEDMGHVWPGFEAERIEAWLAKAGFRSARVTPMPPEPEAKGPLLFLATAVA